METQKFAQKFIIYDPRRNSILVSKYLTSKYLPTKLIGKLCLPGGKAKFGENPEQSAIREVLEETGVLIKPWEILNNWTWVYQKDSDTQQIFANARIGLYVSGAVKKPNRESETTLARAVWIKIEKLAPEKFVADEIPAIKLFLQKYFCGL